MELVLFAVVLFCIVVNLVVVAFVYLLVFALGVWFVLVFAYLC